ncbi:MAG: hypothetical protein ABFD97_01950 [Syntrophobacter sp.]
MAKFLILAFLIFCFLPHSVARGQAAKIAGDKTFRFNDLLVGMSALPGNDGYLLEFSRQGRNIYTGECAFRVREPKVVSDFPAQKCRSLMTYCFSGGAHCCMSLIIASECGSLQTFNVIDLAHSDSDVKFVETGTKGVKALQVIDWQFAYYSVEGTELELSFADSPGMTRLLVFEEGKWRPDRIGEFAGFYAGMLRDAGQTAQRVARKRSDPEVVAGTAISVAYYCIMSGKSLEEAERELKQRLPHSWKDVSGKIVRDIRRATLEFNPVQVID